MFLSDEIRARLRRNPVFVPPELRSMLSYDLASLNSVPRYAGSRKYEVHVFQRALFPLTAGRHEIPPARLEYALPLSNSFFAREESHSARTQSLVVIAREPPLTGRPRDIAAPSGDSTCRRGSTVGASAPAIRSRTRPWCSAPATCRCCRGRS